MTTRFAENVAAGNGSLRSVGPRSLSTSHSSSLSSTESIDAQLPDAIRDDARIHENLEHVSGVALENEASGSEPVVEESLEARIDRLGRQRPEVFGSVWAEVGFVFSICMAQVLTVSFSP
jgi:hypothetical protein